MRLSDHEDVIMPDEPASPPVVSPITFGDIEAAMALVVEAGWNQTSDDWAFMLKAGHGFGLRDNGRLIATGIVLPYRPRVAWIGMVLVNGPYRQRGHATRLLRHCMAMAEGAGLVPMLDATPAGREVYGRLGFLDGPRLQRWRGKGGGTGVTPSATGTSDITDVTAMDAAAMGGSREVLLRALAMRSSAQFRRHGTGALFTRPGRTATQIGPVLAMRQEDAVSLCHEAIQAIDGPVLIDVPERETDLSQLLTTLDFEVERDFTRMALSEIPVLGETMRAIAGPELG